MKRIYFDNAASSFPKPRAVSDAVYRYMTEVGSNINRGGYDEAYEAEDTVFECRERLCNLFCGSDPKNLVFTGSITQSLNIIIKGLLRPGDHVLVSAMEHNAVMRPITQLKKQGIEFCRIPADKNGQLILSELPSLIKKNTRLMVCTHASNVNGAVQPIEALGRICRENGIIFIVDSAQTAGVLDIDMERQFIDCLCFTGHKGLMGPQGTGGFLLRDGLKDDIEPLISGGTGSLSHTEEIPDFMPDRFEPGTLNLPGIYGLNAAVKWLSEQGIKSIRDKEQELCSYFLSSIAGIYGVEPVGRGADAEYAAVLSLRFPGNDPAELARRLDYDYGIATRVGLHCAPNAHKTLGTYPEGTLRLSFGYFNTKEEIDYAVQAIGSLCKNSRA